MTEPAWLATPGPSSHWGRSMLWPVQTKGRCTWLTGGEGEIIENICILLLRRTGEWMLTGRQQYPLQQCSSSFSTHTSPAEDLPRCTFRFSRSAAGTSTLHFQQLVGHGALLVPLAHTGATPHQCLYPSLKKSPPAASARQPPEAVPSWWGPLPGALDLLSPHTPLGDNARMLNTAGDKGSWGTRN